MEERKLLYLELICELKRLRPRTNSSLIGKIFAGISSGFRKVAWPMNPGQKYLEIIKILAYWDEKKVKGVFDRGFRVHVKGKK
jgi:hypothetical protein